MTGSEPIRLRLLSRPGCHLCEEMRQQVDALLWDREREWEITDVDSKGTFARYGDVIPVLFVNGRLFAKTRLPRLALRLRLLRRAAGKFDDGATESPGGSSPG